MAIRLDPRRPQPDTDLEDVHEEVFGLRPLDLDVPLSEQGLPIAIRGGTEQPAAASSTTPEDGQNQPIKAPREGGEGAI